MWAASQKLAIEEVATQYGIEGDAELYYSNVCRVMTYLPQGDPLRVTHDLTSGVTRRYWDYKPSNGPISR